MELKEFKKYRWFFTSLGKLVIGGKSAIQNEEILKKLKSEKKDYTIMHTAEPGSPFSVILSDKTPTSSELEQTAIFTAAFSRAWRQGKKKVEIHIFNLSQLYKKSSMKQGTWGVKGEIKKKSTKLGLVITKQKSKLRAVPEGAVKSKKQILLRIVPGKIDKSLLLPKLQILLPSSFSQEEVLSALPSGGIKIQKS